MLVLSLGRQWWKHRVVVSVVVGIGVWDEVGPRLQVRHIVVGVGVRVGVRAGVMEGKVASRLKVRHRFVVFQVRVRVREEEAGSGLQGWHLAGIAIVDVVDVVVVVVVVLWRRVVVGRGGVNWSRSSSIGGAFRGSSNRAGSSRDTAGRQVSKLWVTYFSVPAPSDWYWLRSESGWSGFGHRGFRFCQSVELHLVLEQVLRFGWWAVGSGFCTVQADSSVSGDTELWRLGIFEVGSMTMACSEAVVA